MERSITDWKRNIVLFLISQAITMFGSSLVQFAIVWYVAKTTQSGVMVMLMTMCGFLPQVLISIFAGVWADRHSRKLLIILSDAGIAIFTLLLAFVVMHTDNFLWALMVISALRSCGAGIQTPAVNAVIPQIVPREKLMRISGINTSVQSIINLAAPAASGAMLTWSAFHNILLVDAVTAVIGITILLFVPVKKLLRVKTQEGGYFDDLKAGLAYSFGNQFIRQLLCITTLFCFLIVSPALLNVLLVTRVFGDTYWHLTLNEMTFFIGALLGGIILSAWGGFKNRLKTLGWGGIVFGITACAIGIIKNFWVYIAIMFVVGVAMPFNNTPLLVLIQEKVEQEMQGRVFSLIQIVSALIIPIGMAVFGPLADLIPIQYLMIGSGISLFLMAIFVFHWKSFYSAGLRPDINANDQM